MNPSDKDIIEALFYNCAAPEEFRFILESFPNYFFAKAQRSYFKFSETAGSSNLTLDIGTVGPILRPTKRDTLVHNMAMFGIPYSGYVALYKKNGKMQTAQRFLIPQKVCPTLYALVTISGIMVFELSEDGNEY